MKLLVEEDFANFFNQSIAFQLLEVLNFLIQFSNLIIKSPEKAMKKKEEGFVHKRKLRK